MIVTDLIGEGRCYVLFFVANQAGETPDGVLDARTGKNGRQPGGHGWERFFARRTTTPYGESRFNMPRLMGAMPSSG